MDLVSGGVELLIFLAPGFLALKVLTSVCSTKPMDAHEFVVDALLFAVVIYALVSLILPGTNELSSPVGVVLLLGAALAVGFIASMAKEHEWLSKLFGDRVAQISTHERILPSKGAAALFGHWCVIGLKSGKEIFGFIRSVDPATYEMLIEDAQWVVAGQMTGQPTCIYLPAGTEVEFIKAQ